jgi:serine/threonine protein kinase
VLRANSKIEPEIGYSNAVDMWSIGIMASYLLCGRNPMAQENSLTSDRAIVQQAGVSGFGDYFEKFIASEVGINGSSLLRGLCELDEQRRLTAEEALEHPWFRNNRLKKSYQILITDWKAHRVSVKQIELINSNEGPMMVSSFDPVIAKESTQLCQKPRRVLTPKVTAIAESPKPPVPDGSMELSKGDSINNENQRIQDMIARDICEINTNWDFNEPSIPRPNNSFSWDLPGSESEADTIESTTNERVIRKVGNLPLTGRKLDLSRRVHKPIQKPKRIRHAFRRQLKTASTQHKGNLLIGDGFEHC